MRYVMFGAVLLLTTAAPARADVGLTDAVAAAFLTRTVDAQLHEIAHQRAAELAACRCLEHDGIRSGTAEVLALSEGMPNPAAHAVSQWIGSPTHNGILSNATYGRIGCADGVAGDVHYLACVLAAGPLPPQPAPVAPSVISLPDTAFAARSGPVASAAAADAARFIGALQTAVSKWHST